jgi:serine/threonine-protein kinase
MRRATILATALVCLAADACAQPVDPEALIASGLELRRQHRDAEALDAFRRAYAASPTPRALAQIAFAEQALGNWVDAEADLQNALMARDDRWIARNLALLQRGLASIEEHLGWIEIAADVSLADVWVNGVDLGTQPLPCKLRVEAGSVDVELRATGYDPARRLTYVAAGGSGHESIHLVPLAIAPPPEPPEPAPTTTSPAPMPATAAPPPEAPGRPDPAKRNTGLVALGAGAIALGLGTYFGLRTLSTKSERDQYCSGPTCRDMRGVELDQQARTLALDCTAWFTAGIVAAGVGASLLWVLRSDAHPAHSGVVRVTPMVGADRAGAQLGGEW